MKLSLLTKILLLIVAVVVGAVLYFKLIIVPRGPSSVNHPTGSTRPTTSPPVGGPDNTLKDPVGHGGLCDDRSYYQAHLDYCRTQ